MLIKAIYTHNMRNDMHFQFMTEFRILLEADEQVLLKVKPMHDLFMPLFQEEDRALKKICKSAKTKMMNDADKARDEIWYAITDMISAGGKHFDLEGRKAAKLLEILFNTYGNVTRKRPNEETSALTNILQDLKGEYAPHAALLGLTPWVNELETRNNAFATLARERIDEKAAKTTVALKDARASVNAVYRSIVNRINSNIDFEGAALYEDFATKLNLVITAYAASLNRPRKNPPKKPKKQD